jgi:porin
MPLGSGGVNPRLDLAGFVGAQVIGDGRSDARFTGRADLFVDFSSKGMGLWDGTTLRTHTELRYSDTNAFGFGRALWPQNLAAALPLTGEGIEVTSVYVLQSLGPKTNLMIGKINMLELLDSDPFFGGGGTRRFQNLAFVAPPTGVVPVVTMGAILLHQAGDVGITAMVFDPADKSGDYWIDDAFETGVNFSLGATWKGDWGGRATSIGLTATGSTKRGLDLGDILVPPGFEAGTRKGSYSIAATFAHDLHGSTKAPSHLGFYAKAAIADGNPNLIRSSLVTGIKGHGLVARRSRDHFGLGFYYHDFSNSLQNAAEPLIELDNEAGAEAYYAFALHPNAFLTFDAQVTDPITSRSDSALVLSARLGLHF